MFLLFLVHSCMQKPTVTFFAKHHAAAPRYKYTLLTKGR